MSRLSFQIDNGPVFFTLLNMAEIQINCCVAPYATGKQNSQKRSITFFLRALAIGSLPQRLRLFGGEPVSYPYTDFLNASNPADPCSQIRA